jgi:uncharacterized damage-inducible protein DinB
MIKYCVGALLGLLTALPVHSQSIQATAGPITSVIGSSVGQYVRWLTAAFDSIPERQYTYRPRPAQRSIGEIAQHLEHANYELCAKFGDLPYRMTSKDSLADSIKGRWPKDTLTARLKASFEFCRRAFFSLTDAKLADEMSPIAPTTPPVTYPRARFVVLFDNDLVDHWSQIASYMRLLGMVPPSALPRKR